MSHLKILRAECFASTLREGLTHETLVKLTAWHDSSASSHMLLTCPFSLEPFSQTSRELVAKCIDLHFMLDSLPT